MVLLLAIILLPSVPPSLYSLTVYSHGVVAGSEFSIPIQVGGAERHTSVFPPPADGASWVSFIAGVYPGTAPENPQV